MALLMLNTVKAETKFNRVVNGQSKQTQRVLALLSRAEKVINSQKFKLKVLNSTFTSTKDSPEEIVRKIECASETFNKNGCNYLVDINWEFARNKRYVLGWTYPNSNTIYFNSRNFNGRDDSGIVGTICHEYMHKLGYGHKSASDLNSVPYSVGTICANLDHSID